MHKTASEMRERRKVEAVEEKKRVDALKSKDGEAYLANLYEARSKILQRMTQRAKQKEELQKIHFFL